MPYNSVPVDTSHLPYCFTRLPVRIHRDKEEIQRFTLELVHATKTEVRALFLLFEGPGFANLVLYRAPRHTNMLSTGTLSPAPT